MSGDRCVGDLLYRQDGFCALGLGDCYIRGRGLRETLGREIVKGASREHNDPQRPEEAENIQIVIRRLPAASTPPGPLSPAQLIKAERSVCGLGYQAGCQR
jgi:hypothetical protein